MATEPEGPTIGALLGERIGSDSQAAAMAALAVSQGTISRYLSGDMIPGDDKVEALSAFLGRPEDEVVQILFRSRRNRATLQRQVERLTEEVAELRAIVEQALEQKKATRGKRAR